MQVPLPDPHPLGTFPFAAVVDNRLAIWRARLLRSLQEPYTAHPQLAHVPIYAPFSTLYTGVVTPPFLISAIHVFEWKDLQHGFPILVLSININPAHHSTSPLVHQSLHAKYGCPFVSITFWDCPSYLPQAAFNYIHSIEESFDNGVTDFLPLIDNWIDHYHQDNPLDYSPFVANSPPPLDTATYVPLVTFSQ